MKRVAMKRAMNRAMNRGMNRVVRGKMNRKKKNE